MDIYSEVQSSDPADLINSPFGGRYCGPIPPRARISLYRAVALSFFTSKNISTPDLFGGRYSFINACKYHANLNKTENQKKKETPESVMKKSEPQS